MAELLSPGVFIEEIPSSAQVIAPVSTSNMGTVGLTQRGPVNDATLVSSFDEYTRVFGDLIRDSRVGLSVAAFFANGGRRAFVVRIVRSDATSADCKIRSKTTDQQIETGDGATAIFTKTASTSLFKDNAGASPLVPSSISVRWRVIGTPVVLQDMRNRANGADVPIVNGTLNYEARINPGSLVTFDEALDSVVRGTVSIVWNPLGAGDITQVIGSGTGSVVTATSGQGSVFTFDHRSGFLSVKFAGTDSPGVGATLDLRASFTPTSVTRTATDNGAGIWTGNVGAPGTISYTDGSYTLNLTGFVPHNLGRVLATYRINAWDLNPISAGAWGNDVRVEVSGSANYFTAATATYTRFDVQVLLRNSSTGVFEIVESYEELDFSTTTSATFFPDVVNDLSDLITVTEPGGNEASGELNGVARVHVIGGGEETTPNRTFSAITLAQVPLAKRSIVITWTEPTGTARTATDDGNGNITGNVGTGTNTINYTTGALSFVTVGNIQGGTLVTVTYRSAVAETTHTETFGDTVQGYTQGSDGVAPVTRTQISDPALNVGDGSGMYALNQVDELMQLIIPDFPDDTVIVGDQIDYAENRKDRFVILTVGQGSSAQDAVDYFRFTLNRQSQFAAMYWPWVKIADPLSDNRSVPFPPLGHIAGIYARTDTTRNVGKSPGGTVDGQLRFLTGLEKETTQGERDLVYPNKINPLISSPQTGLAVWGVRTISLQSEWRYINARRLFMFVEKSTFNATHWIIFENNGPGLWTRIKLQLDSFLNNLFADGFFAGTKPDEGFFVICDETNNPQFSIDAGIVNIDIGIAPNKPAEFARFRFQQKTLGS